MKIDLFLLAEGFPNYPTEQASTFYVFPQTVQAVVEQGNLKTAIQSNLQLSTICSS